VGFPVLLKQNDDETGQRGVDSSPLALDGIVEDVTRVLLVYRNIQT
jgi:hypothetical protein